MHCLLMDLERGRGEKLDKKRKTMATPPRLIFELFNCSVSCPREVHKKKNNKVMDGVATSSHKSPTGLRHAQSLDNVSWNSTPPKVYWPAVDKVRIIDGFHFDFF